MSLAETATIYDHSGEAGLAEEPLLVTGAPDGRIFMVTIRLRPVWFRPTGAFGGFLGRPGEGPGEFRGVRFIQAFGDSIHTYDPSLNRRSTWTSSGTFLSSRPSIDSPFGGAVPQPDGSMVVSEPFNRPRMAGLPFHHFDEEGQWIRSFGPEAAVVEGPDARRIKRLVAPGSDSYFFAVQRHDYVLERVSPLHGVVEQSVRDVEWFRSGREIMRLNQEEPFTPMVRSVVRDPESGRLWILSNLPDERWREGISDETTDRFGFTRTTIADFDRVYDSVIEVIDPEAGVVVASQRFDRYLIEFVDSDQVAGYGEDSLRVPIITVFSMSLEEPPLGGVP